MPIFHFLFDHTYVLGSSLIWTCQILNFQYLLLFSSYKCSLKIKTNIWNSTCTNQWATKNIVASNYKWKMDQIFVAFSEYSNFIWTACTFIGRNQTSFCTIWIKKARTARFDSTNINTWYQRYKLSSTPQSTNWFIMYLFIPWWNFKKNIQFVWSVKLSKKWEIFSNFVTFSQYQNFTEHNPLLYDSIALYYKTWLF